MLATPQRTKPAAPPGPRTTAAVRAVATDRRSQVLFVVLAAVIAAGYSVLLPFAFTQRLTLANWQFLTTRLLAFAVLLAVGMAVVLTVQVYAVRRAAAARRAGGTTLSGAAFVLSLAPTLLCCTPVIPTVLAAFGLSAVSVYTMTGSLQRFFAVHQTALFAVSLVLLAATAGWSLRRIACASCLNDAGCIPTAP